MNLFFRHCFCHYIFLIVVSFAASELRANESSVSANPGNGDSQEIEKSESLSPILASYYRNNPEAMMNEQQGELMTELEFTQERATELQSRALIEARAASTSESNATALNSTSESSASEAEVESEVESGLAENPVSASALPDPESTSNPDHSAVDFIGEGNLHDSEQPHETVDVDVAATDMHLLDGSVAQIDSHGHSEPGHDHESAVAVDADVHADAFAHDQEEDRSSFSHLELEASVGISEHEHMHEAIDEETKYHSQPYTVLAVHHSMIHEENEHAHAHDHGEQTHGQHHDPEPFSNGNVPSLEVAAHNENNDESDHSENLTDLSHDHPQGHHLKPDEHLQTHSNHQGNHHSTEVGLNRDTHGLGLGHEQEHVVHHDQPEDTDGSHASSIHHDDHPHSELPVADHAHGYSAVAHHGNPKRHDSHGAVKHHESDSVDSHGSMHGQDHHRENGNYGQDHSEDGSHHVSHLDHGDHHNIGSSHHDTHETHGHSSQEISFREGAKRSYEELCEELHWATFGLIKGEMSGDLARVSFETGIMVDTLMDVVERASHPESNEKSSVIEKEARALAIHLDRLEFAIHQNDARKMGRLIGKVADKVKHLQETIEEELKEETIYVPVSERGHDDHPSGAGHH